MKKWRILSAVLVLTMLLVNSAAASAEMPDFASMTNEELAAVLVAARAELNARELADRSAPEEILQSLQTAGLDLRITEVFTEETDLNHLLGRPGRYIGKADFSIGEVEENTIETFSSPEDCNSRYEYLIQYTDASLGMFGLNQYIYKGNLSILRISFDLTPTKAAEYEAAYYALVGQAAD